MKKFVYTILSLLSVALFASCEKGEILNLVTQDIDLNENSAEYQDYMKERIDTLLQGLAHYEQIKRFTLLPHHFAMETGELTNTLKMRRPVIYKNYKNVIDKMYEENQ